MVLLIFFSAVFSLELVCSTAVTISLWPDI